MTPFTTKFIPLSFKSDEIYVLANTFAYQQGEEIDRIAMEGSAVDTTDYVADRKIIVGSACPSDPFLGTSVHRSVHRKSTSYVSDYPTEESPSLT